MDFEAPEKSGMVQSQYSPDLEKSGKSAKMEGKHSCQHCEKSFPEKKNLNRHMKDKHPEELLKQQQVVNVAEMGMVYTCDVCEATFKKEQALKDHRRRKHTKE